MSSLTRAVTSRLGNGRQRLTSDKGLPSTSEFNYIIPPEIIWEDYQATHKEPLKIDVEQEPEPKKLGFVDKKSSQSIFTQKMNAVVRKLSPFSDDGKDKDSSSSSPNSEDSVSTSKKSGPFRDTKQKMDKLKKARRSKDRQQLIDSSEDEM
ncbi:unnamed protein product [Caenorhabditis bovis]|uniref:Uncharacterized protein n=1 Tax=Caenorhabditis bovis TaxID=2654633 RepID=A0A8S1EMZ1_9PELO|nr:unnamed protein product [Caenorhabditis bovis]